jgi:hypothetical protein
MPRPMLVVRPASPAKAPVSPDSPFSSVMVMPASSLIRKNLKRSRKLPWLDRLFEGMSPSSSILLSVSSGLLPSVFIEAFVFRRSVVVAGCASAFLLEEFRDNHENGLVSFRETGGGGAAFSCAGGGGGGGNLTGDILPERPCNAVVESRESLGGSLGTTPAAFAPSVQSQTVPHLRACTKRVATYHRLATRRPCLKPPRFCVL